MQQKIEVVDFTPDMREQWEEFVERSNNGTMFHKHAFLDYHPSGKFEFHHLVFLEDGDIIGILPGGFVGEKKDYWSPVGASYGSLVTGDIAFEKALALVDALLDHGRTHKWRSVYLIPPPLIYSKNISQHIEYALLYRKFGFELHYISHAIQLKRGSDFLQFFDKTARKSIRKVLREKKITIRESDDYATFHKILVENKSRRNAKPTHSLEDLIKLRALIPDRLRLYIVYHGDTPIAGSLLFLCNAKVVLCFYNMLLYEYQHLKPVYLIMYETVRWAYQRGYEWVDIGVSQLPMHEDPMTPSLDLIQFKERFDARGILRTTYHYQF